MNSAILSNSNQCGKTRSVRILGLLLGGGALLLSGLFSKTVFAESNSVLYVPLIGITAVPDPLVLPSGAGKVTYHYAIKNFLREESLSDVTVTDDKCESVKFLEGDDNGDSKLDFSETWRFTCMTTLSETTQNTATAKGNANKMTAKHKAYATVVVGSHNPPPLVSIINVTKIAYPLSLPIGGGDITYTYKVNNPGIVALSNVTVVDDKCSGMSSRLGDVNNNDLLDIKEVWIYNCTVNLTETVTNTVKVTAFSNGLKATDEASVTVQVKIASEDALTQASPSFPNTGSTSDVKAIVWKILGGVLIVLVPILIFTRTKSKSKNTKKARSSNRGRRL